MLTKLVRRDGGQGAAVEVGDAEERVSPEVRVGLHTHQVGGEHGQGGEVGQRALEARGHGARSEGRDGSTRPLRASPIASYT